MSRSVAYQSEAKLVKYTHVEPVYGEFNPDTEEYEGEEYNDFESRQVFEDTCENIKYALKEAFPSFAFIPDRQSSHGSDARAWQYADRECWPLLRNGNCIVYLAEYCGLISISFCPAADFTDDYFPENRRGIQESWIARGEKKINTAIESVTDRLVCCGRFSNGEAIFSKVSNRAELSAAINGEAI